MSQCPQRNERKERLRRDDDDKNESDLFCLGPRDCQWKPIDDSASRERRDGSRHLLVWTRVCQAGQSSSSIAVFDENIFPPYLS